MRKWYRVKKVETWEGSIYVKANSPEEAEETAQDNAGLIVCDALCDEPEYMALECTDEPGRYIVQDPRLALYADSCADNDYEDEMEDTGE